MKIPLFCGGRYSDTSGHLVRTIDRIHGDEVFWRDQCGVGVCSRERFWGWAAALAADSPPPPMEGVVLGHRKVISRAELASLAAHAGNIRDLAALAANRAGDSPAAQRVAGSAFLLVQKLETLGSGRNRMRELTHADSAAAQLESDLMAWVGAAAEQSDALGAHGDSGGKFAVWRSSDIAGSVGRLRSILAVYLSR